MGGGGLCIKVHFAESIAVGTTYSVIKFFVDWKKIGGNDCLWLSTKKKTDKNRYLPCSENLSKFKVLSKYYNEWVVMVAFMYELVRKKNESCLKL